MNKQKIEDLKRSLEQEKELHMQSEEEVKNLQEEVRFLNRCIDVISGRTGIYISINDDIALIRKTQSINNEICSEKQN